MDAAPRQGLTMRKLSKKAIEAGFEIKKRVYRTAYARNGNAHAPTQNATWDVYRHGQLVSSSIGKLTEAVQFAEDVCDGKYE